MATLAYPGAFVTERWCHACQHWGKATILWQDAEEPYATAGARLCHACSVIIQWDRTRKPWW